MTVATESDGGRNCDEPGDQQPTSIPNNAMFNTIYDQKVSQSGRINVAQCGRITDSNHQQEEEKVTRFEDKVSQFGTCHGQTTTSNNVASHTHIEASPPNVEAPPNIVGANNKVISNSLYYAYIHQHYLL